jgi:hypothetical protein
MTESTLLVRLELPIWNREAQARGLDDRLCRLIVNFSKVTLPAVQAATFVTTGRPADKSIGIAAMNEFVALDAVFGEGHTKIRLGDKAQLVVTENADDVGRVLSMWKAEMLLLIFGSLQDFKSRPSWGSTSKRWWKFSNQTPDAEYIEGFQSFDPIILYSPSSASLEFLGSEEVVMAWFELTREPLVER